MKTHQNWYKLVALLMIAGLFLVACERPLPGGYNEQQPEGNTEVYPSQSDSLPAPQEAPLDAEGYPGIVPEAPAAEVPAAEVPADAYPPAAGEALEQAPDAEAAPAATAEGEVPAAEPAAEATPATLPTDAGQAASPDAAATAEPAAEATALPGTHTVATGENLYRISLLYGITWTELAAANGITDPDSLSVGQVLIIPSAATAEAPAAEEAASAAEATPNEAVPTIDETVVETPAATTPTTYIVQAGDNLYRIGLNFGIPWTDIVAANGIVNNFIYPGQELIIPAAEATTTDTSAEATPEATAVPEAVPAVSGVTHIVEAGETVFGIAFQYNITWTSLVQANNLPAPYTLEPGQTLVIPES